ncbi:hypothetical protein GUITHDRAFT_105444 [Guillardia theta CCMP2712]|uniref:Uncharacterized protein n=1 Tax=Guillardia theta (strain CCMP2712) TaxID=905079 RepID=L1JJY2_GUITC|nr:hypothetical protein GUITHDRAFT_105444 [Guillardia theta CCMP2712]EKX48818.1 hypothetical protein GUITHDRAFT_105444 [Guillardia theta CCMP2712]|eukprot:XP_005835798.1 hypothetical protein GUITHDRAFT_105444 [Guillardia theta CCMP2712]
MALRDSREYDEEPGESWGEEREQGFERLPPDLAERYDTDLIKQDLFFKKDSARYIKRLIDDYIHNISKLELERSSRALGHEVDATEADAAERLKTALPSQQCRQIMDRIWYETHSSMKKAAAKYEQCPPEEMDRHYEQFLEVRNLTFDLFDENERDRRSSIEREGGWRGREEEDDEDLVPNFLPENLEAWKTRNLRAEMYREKVGVVDPRIEKLNIPYKIYCFSFIEAFWENWVPSDASKEEEEYISGLKDQIFALYKKKDFAQVEALLNEVLRRAPNCVPALIIRGSLIAGLTLKYKKIEEDELSEHGVWANDPDASSESFLTRDPMTTAAFNSSELTRARGRRLREEIESSDDSSSNESATTSSHLLSSSASWDPPMSSETMRENYPSLELREITDPRMIENLTRARESYEAAYKIDPTSLPATCNLATLLTFFPNASAAYPYIEQARHVDPLAAHFCTNLMINHLNYIIRKKDVNHKHHYDTSQSDTSFMYYEKFGPCREFGWPSEVLPEEGLSDLKSSWEEKRFENVTREFFGIQAELNNSEASEEFDFEEFLQTKVLRMRKPSEKKGQGRAKQEQLQE